MKCRYQIPHQPRKCGLLNSSWNDPVAMMERWAKSNEKDHVYIDALRVFAYANAAQRAQEHHTGG